jgi:NitT/TauT family transport system ATP-binding protein
MNNLSICVQAKHFPAVGKALPKCAIADLSMSVQAGEFVCLIGPSGCGKTTLLNIIAGVDTQFTGNISYSGKAVLPKIGVVFQQPRLLAWRTVRENIDLVLANPSASAHSVDELLALMNLTDVQHVYPERLSLGMSRRVAIIRAFAIAPEVLLMDEPFVSLDIPAARQVREALLSLWLHRPHSVIFVSHDLREAIALADRILFLSSSPMHVISEVKVTIPRNTRNDEHVINAFREQLKHELPHLHALF